MRGSNRFYKIITNPYMEPVNTTVNDGDVNKGEAHAAIPEQAVHKVELENGNTVETPVPPAAAAPAPEGQSFAVPPVPNTGADVTQGEEAAPVVAPAPEPESAPAAPAAPDAPAAPVAPTPEEQAEIDAMVDFVVTEETLAELNAHIPDGMTPLKVGDTVKLAPTHPLVAPVATPEGGTPTV